jgi:hypothetical protein
MSVSAEVLRTAPTVYKYRRSDRDVNDILRKNRWPEKTRSTPRSCEAVDCTVAAGEGTNKIGVERRFEIADGWVEFWRIHPSAITSGDGGSCVSGHPGLPELTARARKTKPPAAG